MTCVLSSSFIELTPLLSEYQHRTIYDGWQCLNFDDANSGMIRVTLWVACASFTLIELHGFSLGTTYHVLAPAAFSH